MSRTECRLWVACPNCDAEWKQDYVEFNYIKCPECNTIFGNSDIEDCINFEWD